MARRTTTGLAALLAILSLTAPWTAGAARATVPAGRDETVTLVTHDSFAVSEKVFDAFTKRTGIDVEVLQAGDAGQVVNQAILTKDDPIGDVLFGIDNTFLTRALDAGIFDPYQSPELTAVPAALRLDSRHRVTPIDYGDVCINYDKKWFASRDLRPPRALADLTKKRYRGLLVVEDPSTSSPGLAFLLATVAEFGPQGWTQYWKELRANDVTVVDGWEQAYYDEFSGGGAGGSRPLVVSYASSPPVAVHFADPPIDDAPTATMTESCFRQIEFAGVLEGTPNRAAARELVDFMLSERFQRDVPLQMFVFPAREGTALPDVFEQHAQIPEQPYTMRPTRIGARRDEWIREWTDAVLR